MASSRLRRSSLFKDVVSLRSHGQNESLQKLNFLTCVIDLEMAPL